MTPQETTALLDKADEHLEKSEYPQAEKLANEVLSTGLVGKDDEARAYCILGSCYIKTGHKDETLKLFQNALALAEASSNPSLQSRALNGIALVEFRRDEYNAALNAAIRSLHLAEKAENKRGQAGALIRIGRVHNGLSDYPRALNYYSLALAINEEIGDHERISECLLNIGQVYHNLADYPRALEYRFQALAKSEEIEEIGDRYVFKHCLSGICETYLFLGDYPHALEYANRRLQLAKEDSDKDGVEGASFNLGMVHSSLGNFAQALDYYFQALKIAEESNSRSLLGPVLINIGNVYSQLDDYDRALDYHTRALVINEEIANKQNCAINLGNIGLDYMNLANYPQALIYLKRALTLCEEIGARRPMSYWLGGIAEVEHKLSNLDAAYQGFVATLHHQRDVLKTNEDVAATLLELGRVVIEQGKTEEGLTWLEEALALAEELGQKKTVSEANKEISNAYSKKGDIAKAFEHLTKHLTLDKEIFSEESRKSVEKFNMRVAIAEQQRSTDRERHEKELEKMKREQLERELSNTTLQFLAQTELISNFRNEMMEALRKLPPTEPVAKELREKLKSLPSKSIDWKKFDTQFAAAHPEFTKKLIELYPDLTAAQVRICSLIRMNMKSEEIARLFCLTERNIENHRYRIRGKMKLKRDQDLALHLAKM